MRSLFRSITRLLLLVMLTTVFSPTFGWDAVQVMAAHDESAPMHGKQVDHAAHDGHAQHDAAMHDGCGSECAGGDSCADNRHHCCPGHVLGHLLGGTSDNLAAAITAGSSVMLVGRDANFSSRVPEGLERPPRASAA